MALKYVLVHWPKSAADRKGHIMRYREATGKLEKAIEAFNARKDEIS